jgi:L-amino acid N-acyltransferase YncA
MRSRDVKEIRACAKKAQVEIKEMKQTRKHYRVVVLGNKTGLVFVSVSPSDESRAYRNVVTDMRKAGYV